MNDIGSGRSDAGEQAHSGKKAGSRVFSCLKDLLAYYAQTAPRRNAILAPGRRPITYGALWTHVKCTVRELRSKGAGRNDRVAVVLPDGPEAAMAIIAVATGAVCMPLNPSFTGDEWRRYFRDLRVSVLLTRRDIGSASRDVAHELGIPVVDLPPRLGEGLGAFGIDGWGTEHAGDGDFASSGDDAFMLLTSGSTSRPKSVPLIHAAVCRSAYNVGAVLGLRSRDRLLSVLPLFHGHGLISGVLAALAAGSSVVCTPGFDPIAFFDWLAEFRPTWYTAVPAIHRAVLSVAGQRNCRAQRSALRLVRSASSTLPPTLIRELEALFGVPVIDTYGMTEAATQIAANPLRRRKPGSVGKAAGADIAILDREGRQLPPGQRGEIALRGPTVTRGYDNDGAATAAAFRDGWFRTGDLGYLDRDGYLFIVGRIKDVIKRGGQQVAPAEVEEVLFSHPEVIDAVVFPIPHKRLGEDVAAAVVLRPGGKVSARQLRDLARERLAAFKIPGVIRIVPQIPKGPGGKIKRAELAAVLSTQLPTTRAETGGGITPPGSKLESQLAKIWADLLELNEIGVDHDVFALGADSITVAQMISRLRARFGIDCCFDEIFESRTVAALAARLAASATDIAPGSVTLSAAPPEIERVESDGPQHVSTVQEQVLRIERELPGLPQFNRVFSFRLQGRLNVSALKRSFAEVVRRHDSLRTRFAWASKRPVALIARADAIRPVLAVEDLAASARAPDERAKALLLKMAKLQAEQEALTPVDVNRAPLIRARLLRLGADDHVLLLTLHEIIVDGWSIAIVMEELSEFYAAVTDGRTAQLAEPTLGFFDFERWQRRWCTSGAATRQLAYWKERLRGVSPVFPTNGDAEGTLFAARVAKEPLHLSNDLVARLNSLSRKRGATLFMTLLTAFKALLLARSGQEDICVATPMANRSQLSMERVIGPIANTVLIRTQLNADLSFEQALGRVREAVSGAWARQDIPYDILAARLPNEDAIPAASLTNVSFVLQTAYRRPFKLPGVAVRSFATRETERVVRLDRTWLNMTLRETPSGISGTCRHKKELFAPESRRHWIPDYKMILAKAAANPRTSLGRLADC